MTAIFISHRSTDNLEAQALKDWLALQGHERLFLDFDPADGIPAGVDWEQRLYRELRRCQALLIVLTPAWLESKWCSNELAIAREKGKPVFVVRVKPCPLGPVVPAIQEVDLTVDRQAALQKLARGLQEHGLDPKRAFDWKPGRPIYPGLAAFDVDDAAVFFGRGKESLQACEALRHLRLQAKGSPKLLLITGASGSGKSSLMRAGLLARLRKEPATWIIAKPFRRSSDALTELAEAIAWAFPAERRPSSIDDIAARLARTDGSRQLLFIARELRYTLSWPDATLVLALDQAEELLYAEATPDATSLLDLLRAALAGVGQELVVVATLRSDRLAAWQQHPSIKATAEHPDLPFEAFPLGPMPMTRIGEIVRGPADYEGLNIEDNLVDALRVGTATPDALPLLAYTLRYLYDTYSSDGKLTFTEYRALGGLEGSVRNQANAAIDADKLGDENLAALRDAFVPAQVRATPEGSFIRSRTALASLPERAQPYLRKLVDARLLVVDKDAEGHETIEIAHEALLRVWPLLDGWIRADGEKLQRLDALQRAAQDYAENLDRPDFLIHRDHRLAEAEELMAWPRFAARLIDSDRKYLAACRNAQNQREREEREQRERERRLLEDTLRQRNVTLSSELSMLSLSLVDETFDQALLLSVEATRIEPTSRARSALYKALTDHPHLYTFFRGHITTPPSGAQPRRSKALAFHPTGKMLAAVGGRKSTEIALWKWLDGRISFESFHGLRDMPIGVAFSRDGKLLAGADSSGNIIIWSVTTQGQVHSLQTDVGLGGFALHPNGRWVVTVGHDVRLWDLEDGQYIAGLTKYDVEDAAFSHDGQTLALAAREKIVILKIGTGEATETNVQITTNQKFSVVAVHPNGKSVVSYADGAIYLFDAVTGFQDGETRLTTSIKAPYTTAFAFSQDGNLLASTDNDGIVVYRLGASENEWLRFPYRSLFFDAVAFSPGSRYLAAYHSDDVVTLWNISESRKLGEELGQAHSGDLHHTSDGRVLVVQSGDVVSVTELGEGIVFSVADLDIPKAYVRTVSQNGEWLAFEAGGKLRIFDLNAGVEQPVSADFGEVSAVSFDPGRSVLAIGNKDGTIYFYDFLEGTTCGAPLKYHRGKIVALAYNGDGDRLASGDEASQVQLWDVATGRPATPPLLGAPPEITGFSYARTKPRLAAGGIEGFAIWNTTDGSLITSFGTGSARGTRAVVALHPEGSLLAISGMSIRGISRSWDAIQIWDGNGVERIAQLSLGDDEIPPSDLVFNPQGNSLVACYWRKRRNSVFRWDIDLESWRRRACIVANRNLTTDEWRRYFDYLSYHSTCADCNFQLLISDGMKAGTNGPFFTTQEIQQNILCTLGIVDFADLDDRGKDIIHETSKRIQDKIFNELAGWFIAEDYETYSQLIEERSADPDVIRNFLNEHIPNNIANIINITNISHKVIQDSIIERRLYTLQTKPSQAKARFLVFIDHSADMITAEAKRILDTVADCFSRSGNTYIAIDGHADASEASSHSLSERRANTVKSYLVERGVDPKRVRTVGCGATRLLVSTPKGARDAQNRRVEIRIMDYH